MQRQKGEVLVEILCPIPRCSERALARRALKKVRATTILSEERLAMALILDREVECPERDKHTPCPAGYIQWHEWAEKKGKTHRQIRCKGCDLFTIWVPKPRLVHGQ